MGFQRVTADRLASVPEREGMPYLVMRLERALRSEEVEHRPEWTDGSVELSATLSGLYNRIVEDRFGPSDREVVTAMAVIQRAVRYRKRENDRLSAVGPVAKAINWEEFVKPLSYTHDEIARLYERRAL
jgi:hypothetical protein